MESSNSRAGQTRRLADRLADARRRRFVGRADEIELFRTALQAPEPPFALLFLYGPGGVGKSTLLAEFARIAGEIGVPAILLDCRSMDPSPGGFLLALQRAFDLDPARSPVDALHEYRRAVILIDTYELLAPLDEWLRETFLPQLPEQCLVVIASRSAPSQGWRDDPGWSELMRALPLRNLLPDESRSYLEARGIADDQQQIALDFTYGHPLALSLVADVFDQGDTLSEINPLTNPHIISTLVERFVSGLPSPLHREALEICAHARVTTEALLSSIFGEDDGPELFNWLRGLSFIEQGREGIFPHDLARDVLHADVKWRNQEQFHATHDKVRRHILDRLQRSQGLEQQRTFFDLLYLHRHNPFMRPHYDWKAMGTAYGEAATTDDYPAIVDMLRRDLGRDSARIAEYWLERQPDAFSAYRSHASNLLGFCCAVMLDDILPADVERDPAVKPIWAFVNRHGPMRPGEQIMILRFAMSSDGNRYSKTLENMAAMTFTTRVLTIPRLAWSFIVTPDPDYWHASHTYINQFRSEEAEFDVDGTHFAVYSHDWRVEPPLAWIETLAKRETATDLSLDDLEASRPAPVIVLSRAEFQEAVRQALRDFTRPDNLTANPLMRSRLLTENPGAPLAPERLQAFIREAAETLRSNPKDERLYRAIRRTYIEPAATQELAAESLGLPFSTYRYHLSGGVERITEWLWQREIDPAVDQPSMSPR